MHSSTLSATTTTESLHAMHLADESAEDVSADEVAIILSFLHPMDIMHARVCRTWRDAAKKTIIPLTKYHVDSVRKVNAMRVMSTALPSLQQISVRNLEGGHIYSDGESILLVFRLIDRL